MALTVLGESRQDQQLLDFAAFGFSGLLNIKSAPQEVDDTELTAALNVYGTSDGGLAKALGFAPYVATIGTGVIPGQGLARLTQQVINGVPQAAPVNTMLAQIAGTLYGLSAVAVVGNAGTATQIGATNALGAAALPWSTENVYDPAHAGGACDVLVICTGSGGPYIFDGTTISTPAAWTTSAPSAKYCKLINGVLWFGGIPSQPNLIQGSDINAPESLPYYNAIAVSRPVTGLGSLGAGAQSSLVVGMTKGLAVIGGVGPSTFFQSEISSTDGVAAGRTMVTVDGLLYYLGNSGIYTFDGGTITCISNKVEPWILVSPLQTDFPMNGKRSISWAFYYNRRMHFVYDSGNVGYTQTVLVFDLVLQGWTVLSSPRIGAAVLLDAPGDVAPPLCAVLDSTQGTAYWWDNLNTLAGGLATWQTSFVTNIATKFFKIGDPDTPKQLTRLYVELFLPVAGSIVPLTINVITDYGASSVGTVSIAAITTGVATWDVSIWDTSSWSNLGQGGQVFTKQRIDANLEAEAFAFGVTSSDTNPPYRFIGVSGTISQLGRS